MTKVYYRKAVGGIIVFDLSRKVTLDYALKWKKDIASKVELPNGDPIPCILIGNKSDLSREVDYTEEEKKQFCLENGFLAWFDISVKENDFEDIGKPIHCLVQKIVKNYKNDINQLVETKFFIFLKFIEQTIIFLKKNQKKME
jgi:GTPase SAR1 family protein